jgi:hypothetical protein
MIGYYPINPNAPQEHEDAFGPRFFRTQFYEYMKQACSIDGQTPVLELMLTSGQILDVSHILELKPDHMLVCVFRDTRTCEDTYNTYLRYLTIFRINVLSRPHEERPIGFNMRNAPAVLAEAGEDVANNSAKTKKKAAGRK